MATTYGMTLACKYDLVTGVHKPDDVYMVALYDQGASLNPKTETYSPQYEVRGKGYVAGGKPLQGYEVGIEGTRVEIGWDSLVRWPNATICARHALVYNRTRGGRAMAVLDLGKKQHLPTETGI